MKGGGNKGEGQESKKSLNGNHLRERKGNPKDVTKEKTHQPYLAKGEQRRSTDNGKHGDRKGAINSRKGASLQKSSQGSQRKIKLKKGWKPEDIRKVNQNLGGE